MTEWQIGTSVGVLVIWGLVWWLRERAKRLRALRRTLLPFLIEDRSTLTPSEGIKIRLH
jgi:hypothetical protein